jgi:hypothetical protein
MRKKKRGRGFIRKRWARYRVQSSIFFLMIYFSRKTIKVESKWLMIFPFFYKVVINPTINKRGEMGDGRERKEGRSFKKNRKREEKKFCPPFFFFFKKPTLLALSPAPIFPQL